jgi:Peptidase S24-like
MLDTRRTLDDLIKGRGETYASVSRMLGRNAAYIQQFIKRGSPVQLDDSDIVQLAMHFGVSETLLGGPDQPTNSGLTTVALPVLSSVRDNEISASVRLVDERWLRSLTKNPNRISIITIRGDAMSPTLGNGDEVFFERHMDSDPIRDGFYVIRADNDLQVRRIAIEPQRGRISVITDNLAYPNWNGLVRRSVQLVGRVVWIGHRAR